MKTLILTALLMLTACGSETLHIQGEAGLVYTGNTKYFDEPNLEACHAIEDQVIHRMSVEIKYLGVGELRIHSDRDPQWVTRDAIITQPDGNKTIEQNGTIFCTLDISGGRVRAVNY